MSVVVVVHKVVVQRFFSCYQFSVLIGKFKIVVRIEIVGEDVLFSIYIGKKGASRDHMDSSTSGEETAKKSGG